MAWDVAVEPGGVPRFGDSPDGAQRCEDDCRDSGWSDREEKVPFSRDVGRAGLEDTVKSIVWLKIIVIHPSAVLSSRLCKCEV